MVLIIKFLTLFKNIRRLKSNNFLLLIALLIYFYCNVQEVYAFDAFSGLSDSIFNKFEHYFGVPKYSRSNSYYKYHNHQHSKSTSSSNFSKSRFKSYFFATSSNNSSYFLINFRLKHFYCGELSERDSEIFNLNQLCDGEVNCNTLEGDFNDENYPFCKKKYQKYCNYNGVFIFDPENVKNSFCVCDIGWMGNYCNIKDDKKCGEDKVICHKNAECRSKNVGDSNEEICKCKSGFIGNGIDDCQDINECNENVCDTNNEYCKNLNGGYLCCGNNQINKRCRFIYGEVYYENNIHIDQSENIQNSKKSEINKDNGFSNIETDKYKSKDEYKPLSGSNYNSKNGGAVIIGKGKIEEDIFEVETDSENSNHLKNKLPCNCSKVTEKENPKIILKSKFFDILNSNLNKTQLLNKFEYEEINKNKTNLETNHNTTNGSLHQELGERFESKIIHNIVILNGLLPELEDKANFKSGTHGLDISLRNSSFINKNDKKVEEKESKTNEENNKKLTENLNSSTIFGGEERKTKRPKQIANAPPETQLIITSKRKFEKHYKSKHPEETDKVLKENVKLNETLKEHKKVIFESITSKTKNIEISTSLPTLNIFTSTKTFPVTYLTKAITYPDNNMNKSKSKTDIGSEMVFTTKYNENKKEGQINFLNFDTTTVHSKNEIISKEKIEPITQINKVIIDEDDGTLTDSYEKMINYPTTKSTNNLLPKNKQEFKENITTTYDLNEKEVSKTTIVYNTESIIQNNNKSNNNIFDKSTKNSELVESSHEPHNTLSTKNTDISSNSYYTHLTTKNEIDTTYNGNTNNNLEIKTTIISNETPSTILPTDESRFSNSDKQQHSTNSPLQSTITTNGETRIETSSSSKTEIQNFSTNKPNISTIKNDSQKQTTKMSSNNSKKVVNESHSTLTTLEMDTHLTEKYETSQISQDTTQNNPSDTTRKIIETKTSTSSQKIYDVTTQKEDDYVSEDGLKNNSHNYHKGTSDVNENERTTPQKEEIGKMTTNNINHSNMISKKDQSTTSSDAQKTSTEGRYNSNEYQLNETTTKTFEENSQTTTIKNILKLENASITYSTKNDGKTVSNNINPTTITNVDETTELKSTKQELITNENNGKSTPSYSSSSSNNSASKHITQTNKQTTMSEDKKLYDKNLSTTTSSPSFTTITIGTNFKITSSKSFSVNEIFTENTKIVSNVNIQDIENHDLTKLVKNNITQTSQISSTIIPNNNEQFIEKNNTNTGITGKETTLESGKYKYSTKPINVFGNFSTPKINSLNLTLVSQNFNKTNKMIDIYGDDSIISTKSYNNINEKTLEVEEKLNTTVNLSHSTKSLVDKTSKIKQSPKIDITTISSILKHDQNQTDNVTKNILLQQTTTGMQNQQTVSSDKFTLPMSDITKQNGIQKTSKVFDKLATSNLEITTTPTSTSVTINNIKEKEITKSQKEDNTLITNVPIYSSSISNVKIKDISIENKKVNEIEYSSSQSPEGFSKINKEITYPIFESTTLYSNADNKHINKESVGKTFTEVNQLTTNKDLEIFSEKNSADNYKTSGITENDMLKTTSFIENYTNKINSNTDKDATLKNNLKHTTIIIPEITENQNTKGTQNSNLQKLKNTTIPTYLNESGKSKTTVSINDKTSSSQMSTKISTNLEQITEKDNTFLTTLGTPKSEETLPTNNLANKIETKTKNNDTEGDQLTTKQYLNKLKNESTIITHDFETTTWFDENRNENISKNSKIEASTKDYKEGNLNTKPYVENKTKMFSAEKNDISIESTTTIPNVINQKNQQISENMKTKTTNSDGIYTSENITYNETTKKFENNGNIINNPKGVSKQIENNEKLTTISGYKGTSTLTDESLKLSSDKYNTIKNIDTTTFASNDNTKYVDVDKTTTNKIQESSKSSNNFDTTTKNSFETKNPLNENNKISTSSSTKNGELENTTIKSISDSTSSIENNSDLNKTLPSTKSTNNIIIDDGDENTSVNKEETVYINNNIPTKSSTVVDTGKQVTLKNSKNKNLTQNENLNITTVENTNSEKNLDILTSTASTKLHNSNPSELSTEKSFSSKNYNTVSLSINQNINQPVTESSTIFDNENIKSVTSIDKLYSKNILSSTYNEKNYVTDKTTTSVTDVDSSNIPIISTKKPFSNSEINNTLENTKDINHKFSTLSSRTEMIIDKNDKNTYTTSIISNFTRITDVPDDLTSMNNLKTNEKENYNNLKDGISTTKSTNPLENDNGEKDVLNTKKEVNYIVTESPTNLINSNFTSSTEKSNETGSGHQTATNTPEIKSDMYLTSSSTIANKEENTNNQIYNKTEITKSQESSNKQTTSFSNVSENGSTKNIPNVESKTNLSKESTPVFENLSTHTTQSHIDDNKTKNFKTTSTTKVSNDISSTPSNLQNVNKVSRPSNVDEHNNNKEEMDKNNTSDDLFNYLTTSKFEKTSINPTSTDAKTSQSLISNTNDVEKTIKTNVTDMINLTVANTESMKTTGSTSNTIFVTSSTKSLDNLPKITTISTNNSLEYKNVSLVTPELTISDKGNKTFIIDYLTTVSKDTFSTSAAVPKEKNLPNEYDNKKTKFYTAVDFKSSTPIYETTGTYIPDGDKEITESSKLFTTNKDKASEINNHNSELSSRTKVTNEDITSTSNIHTASQEEKYKSTDTTLLIKETSTLPYNKVSNGIIILDNNFTATSQIKDTSIKPEISQTEKVKLKNFGTTKYPEDKIDKSSTVINSNQNLKNNVENKQNEFDFKVKNNETSVVDENDIITQLTSSPRDGNFTYSNEYSQEKVTKPDQPNFTNKIEISTISKSDIPTDSTVYDNKSNIYEPTITSLNVLSSQKIVTTEIPNELNLISHKYHSTQTNVYFNNTTKKSYGENSTEINSTKTTKSDIQQLSSPSTPFSIGEKNQIQTKYHPYSTNEKVTTSLESKITDKTSIIDSKESLSTSVTSKDNNSYKYSTTEKVNINLENKLDNNLNQNEQKGSKNFLITTKENTMDQLTTVVNKNLNSQYTENISRHEDILTTISYSPILNKTNSTSHFGNYSTKDVQTTSSKEISENKNITNLNNSNLQTTESTNNVDLNTTETTPGNKSTYSQTNIQEELTNNSKNIFNNVKSTKDLNKQSSTNFPDHVLSNTNKEDQQLKNSTTVSTVEAITIPNKEIINLTNNGFTKNLNKNATIFKNGEDTENQTLEYKSNEKTTTTQFTLTDNFVSESNKEITQHPNIPFNEKIKNFTDSKKVDDFTNSKTEISITTPFNTITDINTSKLIYSNAENKLQSTTLSIEATKKYISTQNTDSYTKIPNESITLTNSPTFNNTSNSISLTKTTLTSIENNKNPLSPNKNQQSKLENNISSLQPKNNQEEDIKVKNNNYFKSTKLWTNNPHNEMTTNEEGKSNTDEKYITSHQTFTNEPQLIEQKTTMSEKPSNSTNNGTSELPTKLYEQEKDKNFIKNVTTSYNEINNESFKNTSSIFPPTSTPQNLNSLTTSYEKTEQDQHGTTISEKAVTDKSLKINMSTLPSQSDIKNTKSSQKSNIETSTYSNIKNTLVDKTGDDKTTTEGENYKESLKNMSISYTDSTKNTKNNEENISKEVTESGLLTKELTTTYSKNNIPILINNSSIDNKNPLTESPINGKDGNNLSSKVTINIEIPDEQFSSKTNSIDTSEESLNKTITLSTISKDGFYTKINGLIDQTTLASNNLKNYTRTSSKDKISDSSQTLPKNVEDKSNIKNLSTKDNYSKENIKNTLTLVTIDSTTSSDLSSSSKNYESTTPHEKNHNTEETPFTSNNATFENLKNNNSTNKIDYETTAPYNKFVEDKKNTNNNTLGSTILEKTQTSTPKDESISIGDYKVSRHNTMYGTTEKNQLDKLLSTKNLPEMHNETTDKIDYHQLGLSSSTISIDNNEFTEFSVPTKLIENNDLHTKDQYNSNNAITELTEKITSPSYLTSESKNLNYNEKVSEKLIFGKSTTELPITLFTKSDFITTKKDTFSTDQSLSNNENFSHETFTTKKDSHDKDSNTLNNNHFPTKSQNSTKTITLVDSLSSDKTSTNFPKTSDNVINNSQSVSFKNTATTKLMMVTEELKTDELSKNKTDKNENLATLPQESFETTPQSEKVSNTFTDDNNISHNLPNNFKTSLTPEKLKSSTQKYFESTVVSMSKTNSNSKSTIKTENTDLLTKYPNEYGDSSTTIININKQTNLKGEVHTKSSTVSIPYEKNNNLGTNKFNSTDFINELNNILTTLDYSKSTVSIPENESSEEVSNEKTNVKTPSGNNMSYTKSTENNHTSNINYKEYSIPYTTKKSKLIEELRKMVNKYDRENTNNTKSNDKGNHNTPNFIPESETSSEELSGSKDKNVIDKIIYNKNTNNQLIPDDDEIIEELNQLLLKYNITVISKPLIPKKNKFNNIPNHNIPSEKSYTDTSVTESNVSKDKSTLPSKNKVDHSNFTTKPTIEDIEILVNEISGIIKKYETKSTDNNKQELVTKTTTNENDLLNTSEVNITNKNTTQNVFTKSPVKVNDNNLFTTLISTNTEITLPDNENKHTKNELTTSLPVDLISSKKLNEANLPGNTKSYSTSILSEKSTVLPTTKNNIEKSLKENFTNNGKKITDDINLKSTTTNFATIKDHLITKSISSLESTLPNKNYTIEHKISTIKNEQQYETKIPKVNIENISEKYLPFSTSKKYTNNMMTEKNNKITTNDQIVSTKILDINDLMTTNRKVISTSLSPDEKNTKSTLENSFTSTSLTSLFNKTESLEKTKTNVEKDRINTTENKYTYGQTILPNFNESTKIDSNSKLPTTLENIQKSTISTITVNGYTDSPTVENDKTTLHEQNYSNKIDKDKINTDLKNSLTTESTKQNLTKIPNKFDEEHSTTDRISSIKYSDKNSTISYKNESNENQTNTVISNQDKVQKTLLTTTLSSDEKYITPNNELSSVTEPSVDKFTKINNKPYLSTVSNMGNDKNSHNISTLKTTQITNPKYQSLSDLKKENLSTISTINFNTNNYIPEENLNKNISTTSKQPLSTDQFSRENLTTSDKKESTNDNLDKYSTVSINEVTKLSTVNSKTGIFYETTPLSINNPDSSNQTLENSVTDNQSHEVTSDSSTIKYTISETDKITTENGNLDITKHTSLSKNPTNNNDKTSQVIGKLGNEKNKVTTSILPDSTINKIGNSESSTIIQNSTPKNFIYTENTNLIINEGKSTTNKYDNDKEKTNSNNNIHITKENKKNTFTTNLYTFKIDSNSNYYTVNPTITTSSESNSRKINEIEITNKPDHVNFVSTKLDKTTIKSENPSAENNNTNNGKIQTKIGDFQTTVSPSSLITSQPESGTNLFVTVDNEKQNKSLEDINKTVVTISPYITTVLPKLDSTNKLSTEKDMQSTSTKSILTSKSLEVLISDNSTTKYNKEIEDIKNSKQEINIKNDKSTNLFNNSQKSTSYFEEKGVTTNYNTTNNINVTEYIVTTPKTNDIFNNETQIYITFNNSSNINNTNMPNDKYMTTQSMKQTDQSNTKNDIIKTTTTMKNLNITVTNAKYELNTNHVNSKERSEVTVSIGNEVIVESTKYPNEYSHVSSTPSQLNENTQNYDIKTLNYHNNTNPENNKTNSIQYSTTMKSSINNNEVSTTINNQQQYSNKKFSDNGFDKNSKNTEETTLKFTTNYGNYVSKQIDINNFNEKVISKTTEKLSNDHTTISSNNNKNISSTNMNNGEKSGEVISSIGNKEYEINKLKNENTVSTKLFKYNSIPVSDITESTNLYTGTNKTPLIEDNKIIIEYNNTKKPDEINKENFNENISKSITATTETYILPNLSRSTIKTSDEIGETNLPSKITIDDKSRNDNLQNCTEMNANENSLMRDSKNKDYSQANFNIINPCNKAYIKQNNSFVNITTKLNNPEKSHPTLIPQSTKNSGTLTPQVISKTPSDYNKTGDILSTKEPEIEIHQNSNYLNYTDVTTQSNNMPDKNLNIKNNTFINKINGTNEVIISKEKNYNKPCDDLLINSNISEVKNNGTLLKKVVIDDSTEQLDNVKDKLKESNLTTTTKSTLSSIHLPDTSMKTLNITSNIYENGKTSKNNLGTTDIMSTIFEKINSTTIKSFISNKISSNSITTPYIDDVSTSSPIQINDKLNSLNDTISKTNKNNIITHNTNFNNSDIKEPKHFDGNITNNENNNLHYNLSEKDLQKIDLPIVSNGDINDLTAKNGYYLKINGTTKFVSRYWVSVTTPTIKTKPNEKTSDVPSDKIYKTNTTTNDYEQNATLPNSTDPTKLYKENVTKNILKGNNEISNISSIINIYKKIIIDLETNTTTERQEKLQKLCNCTLSSDMEKELMKHIQDQNSLIKKIQNLDLNKENSKNQNYLPLLLKEYQNNFKKLFDLQDENNKNPPAININLILPEKNSLSITETLSNLFPSINGLFQNFRQTVYKKGNILKNTTPDKYSCNYLKKCNSTLEICNSLSQKCECINGFKRDNITEECIDVNECFDFPNNVCQFPNVHCENVIGTYHCRCNYGYIGDGIVCTKIGDNNFTKIINENLFNTNYTSMSNEKDTLLENINRIDKYNCPKGYIKTGITNKCEDIDECKIYENRICTYPNSECQNIPGSYVCVCKFGYIGDGINCIPSNIINILNNTLQHNNITEKNNFNETINNQVKKINDNKCFDSSINNCNKITEICINDCEEIKCICKKGFIRINGICSRPPQLPKLKSICNKENITMYIPYYQLPTKGYIFVKGMANKQECSKYYDTYNKKIEHSNIEKELYLQFSFSLTDCIIISNDVNNTKNSELIKSLGFVTVHDYNISKDYKKTRFEINCTSKIL